MTSVRGRGWHARRGLASEAPTGHLSSNGDHKDLIGSNEPEFSKAHAGSEAPAGPETPAGPEALPGPPQAPLFPFPRILVLTATANRTWIESSKRFSMSQREDLETNSRPKTRTFTTVDHTWNATIFARNVKTILPPVELPNQTKFCLRPLFYGIESTSAGSCISGS